VRTSLSSNRFIMDPFIRWERTYLYLFIVTSGFFIIFPQVDLDVSRYLFQSGDFFASHNTYMIALRDIHRPSQGYLMAGMLSLLVLYMLWWRPLPLIAPHKVLFVILTFILGSGVLVQGLKLIIGRARPGQLIEFGGTAHFTPAWQLAGVCRHSCSFPSGESSVAAVMLSLLVLVPPRFRVLSAIVLVPLLVLISLNRVFMGAHFLSDVVIAWILILGLMLWLWPRLMLNADTIDNWVRLKGEGLRKKFNIAN